MYETTKNTAIETNVNICCDLLDCNTPHVTKNDHKPLEKWNVTAIVQTI